MTNKKKVTQFSPNEIKTLLKKAKVVFKGLGLLILKAPAPEKGAGRLLLQISKKAGPAPDRNKFRRRIKVIFKNYESSKLSHVFIVRASAQGIEQPFHKLLELFQNLIAAYT